MRVRWRLIKARHAAISFEVVEWSEQLRSGISVWLGAVRCSVQVRLSRCVSEEMFGVISSPCDHAVSVAQWFSAVDFRRRRWRMVVGSSPIHGGWHAVQRPLISPRLLANAR